VQRGRQDRHVLRPVRLAGVILAPSGLVGVLVADVVVLACRLRTSSQDAKKKVRFLPL